MDHTEHHRPPRPKCGSATPHGVAPRLTEAFCAPAPRIEDRY